MKTQLLIESNFGTLRGRDRGKGRGDRSEQGVFSSVKEGNLGKEDGKSHRAYGVTKSGG